MNFIVMDDNPSRPAIKEMGLPLRVRPILLITQCDYRLNWTSRSAIIIINYRGKM